MGHPGLAASFGSTRAAPGPSRSEVAFLCRPRIPEPVAGQALVMYAELLTCCEHAIIISCMSRMLQIRNLPDEVHRRLKSRAALAGMSMSDYVLREIERMLSRPTRDEVFARIAELPPIDLDPPSAEILREERERR